MRRFALLSTLLLACACDGAPKEDDMQAPMQSPPWHMWGNQLAISMAATGGFSDVQSSQLVSIAYGRPETWSWLFWTDIVRSNNAGAPGSVAVLYHLTAGVGRTKVTMRTFVQFVFGAPLPIAGIQQRRTQTIGAVDSILSDFPAQDIVLNVQALLIGAAPGDEVDINVGALFSPKSHIRPEWWEGEFRGEEDRGR